VHSDGPFTATQVIPGTKSIFWIDAPRVRLVLPE
jgi:hypothetical protein